MEPNSVRAFVAVKPPESWVRHFEALQSNLKGRLKGDQFKWTAPEQIHITLRFLGSIDSAAVEEVARSLTKIAHRFPPFFVSMGALGCFPSPRRARVLWLGIESGPEMADLQREIVASTREIGEKPEDRPFQPHLTLARAREAGRSGMLEPILANVQASQDKLSWCVDCVLLMRSHLSSKGARYETLHAAPLGKN